MFCHKCGNQLPEGSAFCQKCGAKLASDDHSQQVGAPELINPIQQQAHVTQTDKPKKKKSKKLLVGLGAIIGLFLIVIIIAANSGDLQEAGEQAKRDEESIASQRQAMSFDLTETYTDEDEWLSFQHPREWSESWTHLLKEYYDTDEVLDNRILMLENSELGNPDDQSAAYISIFRTPHYGYEHEIDAIFNATKENFPENVNVNATIESIADTTLDGAQTRIVEYSMPIPNTDNVAWYKRYYYAVESKLYRVDFLCLQKYWDRYEPTFDAIMDTYKITSAMKITAPESSATGGSASKQDGIVTYNISGYDFASSVPDFLSSVTNGAEFTNENNTDISHGSAATVDLTYTYEWSDDDRNNYHDMLKNNGFSLNGSRDGYYEWTSDDVNIDTYFDNPASVYICIINKLHDDDSGDGDMVYESTFHRTDYFTGISNTDLLRNPDTYAYSKVYFDYFKVTEVLEPKVYLAQSQRWLNENIYIVIDDRLSTGSNALAGDIVTVYGVFSEIITMNWNNGGSSQLPVIRPDRLIFNDVLPDDLTDFAQAMVENMNANSSTIAYNLGVQNQYLSGSTVKLAGLITPLEQGISLLSSGQSRNAGRVDGYDTMITWVYEPNGATKAIPDDFNQNKGQVTKEILNTFGIDVVEVNTNGDALPIWITGEIAFIIPKPNSPPDVIVTFNITNIEPMN